jgi:2-dehydropantoate 2-reductase
LRVAVVGAGAIGAVVAGAAVEGGHQVTVCTRTPVESLTIEDRGALEVRLVGAPAELEAAAEGAGAAPADVVFVTVKATDNDSAAAWLGFLCSPATLLVVVQNGLDHETRFAGAVPAGTRVVPGLAYVAAERIGPGRVRHLSGRRLVVPGPVMEPVAAAVPGLDVRGEADMVTACWQKLLGNLIANPLTALTLRRIDVLAEPGMADLARGLLREAVAVGRASGARLPDEAVDAIVAGAARYGPETGSSMLYDRLAGRPMEHQWITGEVVRRGRAFGIDVPLNRAVLALLDALDRGDQRD